MTSAQIVNGAPMTIMLGTQDLSTQQVTPTPEQIPQHLPLVYLYAQQGPLTTELVSGADLTNMYGTDTFDLRKKWANHATVLANTVNAQGNAIQVQRVQPADAAPPATLRLYLDVLAAQVPQYQRNTDGSFKLDSSGNQVPVTGTGGTATTAAGYIAQWVVEQVTYTETDGVSTSDFGAGQIMPGDLTFTGATGTSQRYPIMDDAIVDADQFELPRRRPGVSVPDRLRSEVERHRYVRCGLHDQRPAVPGLHVQAERDRPRHGFANLAG
jgi:hypothetical protein